jgi:hypothetical protein
MSFRTFVAGETLTAAMVNDYLMKQAVIGCTSGTRPSAPVEAMTIHETDTDQLLAYLGAAWQVGIQYGQWTSYTPTLTQSGAVTKTVTHARYCRSGRSITAQVLLDVTGAGTAANPVIVGLPVAAAAVALVGGSGYVTDTSAGARHGGILLLDSTTTAQFIPSAGSSGVLGTAVFTAALAAGDIVAFTATYEAAA